METSDNRELTTPLEWLILANVTDSDPLRCISVTCSVADGDFWWLSVSEAALRSGAQD
jgi:hypothetical protein